MAFGALGQRIAEPGQVSRRLEDRPGHNLGAVHLEHLVVLNEMAPPEVGDVVPEGPAVGAEIEQARWSR